MLKSACNRTVKPVTRFAINPAKPVLALPAVEAGVRSQFEVRYLFKDNIENISQLFAIGGSFCFLASLVYDWGFYSSISLSYAEIPSTLTDHVRSALIWSPKIGAAFFVYYVFELFFKRVEKGQTEEEIVNSSSNPKLMRQFRDGPYKLIATIAFVLMALYVLLGEHFVTTLAFSLTICWVSFINWVYSHQVVRERSNSIVKSLSIIVPPMVFWLYFTGFNDALKLYTNDKPNTTITTSKNENQTVTILREFEQGVLIKNKSKNIVFIPWSEVKELKTSGKHEAFKGLICVMLKKSCNLNLNNQS